MKIPRKHHKKNQKEQYVDLLLLSITLSRDQKLLKLHLYTFLTKKLRLKHAPWRTNLLEINYLSLEMLFYNVFSGEIGFYQCSIQFDFSGFAVAAQQFISMFYSYVLFMSFLYLIYFFFDGRRNKKMFFQLKLSSGEEKKKKKKKTRRKGTGELFRLT